MSKGEGAFRKAKAFSPVLRRMVGGFLLTAFALAASPDKPSLEIFEVIERDVEKRSLKVVSGDADPRWVRVGEGDVLNDYTGRRIRARAGTSLGDPWLHSIWPVDPMREATMEQINRQLRRETAVLRRRDFLREGDYLPGFALYDQEGDIRTTADFRGRFVVMNFIFTRCQVDQMCPAASRKMKELQALAAAGGMKDDLQLLLMSFDPEHDYPGTLRLFAETYGLSLDNLALLTGPRGVVEDLLRQFGIVVYEEDGTLEHTMALIVTDPSGRIIWRREGSRWEASEVLQRLKAADPNTGNHEDGG